MSYASEFSDTEVTHKDGVAWHNAPAPFPIHRCKPQTDGWVGFVQVQRCRCGAMRTSHGPGWSDRNQRRNPFIRGAVRWVPLVAFLVFGAVIFVYGDAGNPWHMNTFLTWSLAAFILILRAIFRSAAS